jgi:hypothetical protein
VCETDPIWGRIARNEPNFAQAQAADRGNCAKRSQTWGKWGMWAKAVVVWGVARPGSKTCKTNPIWPGRRVHAQNEPNSRRGRVGRGSGGVGRLCKTNPIRATGGRSRAGTPNPRRAEACKTKPIWPGGPGMGADRRGRTAPAECDCAKRTQFRRPGRAPESELD